MIRIICESTHAKKIDVFYNKKKYVVKCNNNIAKIDLPSEIGINHFIIA